ncbi:hypothetical protein [Hymenobacter arizonensis]|uniref:Uncharacterized protein n=1 Tax=Hymenobacter arizonensis TaxID=1227077 RepID=A0A1I6BFL9_HYMAR|nr:hypothetical protein [Hymenobacter arizonensis]SFQ79765.1 hypothetical protein SAMN04515668_4496 [Hymenobacter arizonensis]
MKINDLPLSNAGPRRISFAHASSLLVAQALTEAHARLERHFPTLSWATWGDMLRQLQPDVLVTGNAVTFDWYSLTRRVLRLAASPGGSARDQPVDLTPLAWEAEAPIAYQQQAVRALAELRENLRVPSPLAQALLKKLAQGPAVPPPSCNATPEAFQLPPNNASPPALEQPVPMTDPAEDTVGSRDERREGSDGAPSVPATGQQNTLAPAPRRNASRRRTFRNIVLKHPRGDGKFGFRVRELCAKLRISAASLTEARENPGRLSVNAVVALAEAMGECPLQVLADLVAEAITKSKNGKRGPNGRRAAS